MSAADIFRITDEDSDTLEFLDDHEDENHVKVTMNDETSVYLSLEDLDKLSDALREMYYRRRREAKKASAVEPSNPREIRVEVPEGYDVAHALKMVQTRFADLVAHG